MADGKGAAPAQAASHGTKVPPEFALPERAKPIDAARLGAVDDSDKARKKAEAAEQPVFQVPEPKRGFVEDPLGRHHEVEDVDTYLAAYPGSKRLKDGEVKPSLLGHKLAEVEAAADAGQVEG